MSGRPPTRRPRAAGRQPAAGFTLVEVLAAAAVLAVFLAAALATVRAGLVAERIQVREAAAQAALRRAAAQVVQDLRLAGGGSAVCGPDEVQVRVAGGSIHYRFHGGTLYRNGVPVAHGLSGAGFSCLSAGLVAAWLEAPPPRPGGPARRLELKVALRSP